MEELTLDFAERIGFRLRSLYESWGYRRFKMNKFEEYDLYARNKEFLISDSVITFTDLGGKLMALKPDVTLSIVKNCRDIPGTQQKLYYHENVYRAARGTRSFQELMQVGLECIGDIDDYAIMEVLALAAESLKSIPGDGILDISHLGLLGSVLESIGLSRDQRDPVLRSIGQKNTHELTALCEQAGVEKENIEILCRLIRITGKPEEVLPRVRQLLSGICGTAPLDQLQRITEGLRRSGVEEMLRLDFSSVDDIHYYNGIVFKGFVRGLPCSILSGGQYDNLMRRMRLKSGAIGFAVYLDRLERLDRGRDPYDVDTVILYSEDTPLDIIRDLIQSSSRDGRHVMAQRRIPRDLRYRRLVKIEGSEVEILEDNA